MKKLQELRDAIQKHIDKLDKNQRIVFSCNIGKRNVHDIICSREHFVNVIAGIKKFDVRKGNFKIGDIINYDEMFAGQFTGRSMKVKIKYIAENGNGTFILQIKKLKK